MKNDMQLTVVMAVYNGGRYLRQSVQSILTQTYRDFEFLVIDDCSTDDSVAILESFNDSRIKVHRNINNLGQTKSLNIGLKIASGDYIARIDADDVALPNWLEMQMRQFQKHSEHSVVSTYVAAIDEHNRIKKLYKPPFDREDLILRSIITSPINHVGSVYRKKDVLEVGGYDESYVTAADYALWSKLLRKGVSITTTAEILMAIREHTQSLSRSQQKGFEIGEIHQVVASNIKAFCEGTFSDAQTRLFCRAHYDAGGLTDDEFNEAANITERVYKSVKRPLVNKDKFCGWTKRRRKLIYLKRLFALIGQKKFASAKKFSCNAVKKNGWMSVFAVLWIASWFGQVMLGGIPFAYGKILRWNSRLQLGNQRKAGILH